MIVHDFGVSERFVQRERKRLKLQNRMNGHPALNLRQAMRDHSQSGKVKDFADRRVSAQGLPNQVARIDVFGSKTRPSRVPVKSAANNIARIDL
jgi:hypothetical protein